MRFASDMGWCRTGLRSGLIAGLLLGAIDATAATPKSGELLTERSVAAAIPPAPTAAPRYRGFSIRVDDTLFGGPREFTYERIKPKFIDIVSEFRPVKNGLGLDLGLPESGNMHLSLYSGKDGFSHGKRWDMDGLAGPAGDGFGPVDAAPRLWSIGASLDLVRFRSTVEGPGPDSRVVVNPQLRLDVDALTGLGGDCELLVQGTQWRDADARAVDTHRVVQVSMKWKF